MTMTTKRGYRVGAVVASLSLAVALGVGSAGTAHADAGGFGEFILPGEKIEVGKGTASTEIARPKGTYYFKIDGSGTRIDSMSTWFLSGGTLGFWHVEFSFKDQAGNTYFTFNGPLHDTSAFTHLGETVRLPAGMPPVVPGRVCARVFSDGKPLEGDPICHRIQLHDGASQVPGRVVDWLDRANESNAGGKAGRAVRESVGEAARELGRLGKRLNPFG